MLRIHHLDLALVDEIHDRAGFAMMDDGVAWGVDHGAESGDETMDHGRLRTLEEGDFFQNVPVEKESHGSLQTRGKILDEGLVAVAEAGLPEVVVVGENPLLQRVGHLFVFHEGIEAGDLVVEGRPGAVGAGEQGGDVGDDGGVEAGPDHQGEHGVDHLGLVLGDDIAKAGGGDGADRPVERADVGVSRGSGGGNPAHGNPSAGEQMDDEGDPEQKDGQAAEDKKPGGHPDEIPAEGQHPGQP